MGPLARIINHIPRRCSSTLGWTDKQKRLYPQAEQKITEEGYPLLKFAPSGRTAFDERRKRYVRKSRVAYKVREQGMDPNQDWPSVWPTAKNFYPAAVPLPIRQSLEHQPGKVPRGKYFNTELLKINNFLHLTPPAIKRHCEAIKKFCTPWPEELDTDEKVKKHFPVTYVSDDYLHSAVSIRDPRARKVLIKVNVNDWGLDQREREKLSLLAGTRLDEETGFLRIIVDACPMRKQNEDYANYLITALYFESKKFEEWENDKPEIIDVKPDMEAYRDKVERELGLK